MLVVEVVMQMHGNPWGLSFSTWCVSVVVHLNWKVSGYKDLWKKFSKNFTSYTNNCEVDTTHEMVMLCFQMLKKNSIRCNLYFWNLVVILFFFFIFQVIFQDNVIFYCQMGTLWRSYYWWQLLIWWSILRFTWVMK